ncbi:MAG TPA: RNA methyltransferase [Lacibacter sp.]|nr:RNA methyltransferase [Lacibacter sp.]
MKSFRNKQQRPKKSALIATPAAVLEALRAGEQLDRIYVQHQLTAALLDPLRTEALLRQVPVQKVPVEKLNSFHVPEHGGCIAQRSRVRYQDLQDVISFVTERGQVPLFLLLDGITDIRNIGAIARTAWCCGVQALIIPEKGVGALNEDALLTSAGALEQIAVCRVNSLMKAVDTLHLNGIRVLASEMTATKPVYDCCFNEPCAIVMGGEEKGVYPALMKICDERFSIPMHHGFESLNVSVATGMILYEAMKQRVPALQ